MFLSSKYARLETKPRSLYEYIVLWINLQSVEGGNIGVAFVCTPNIPTERRQIWHLMTDSLPKDYD